MPEHVEVRRVKPAMSPTQYGNPLYRKEATLSISRAVPPVPQQRQLPATIPVKLTYDDQIPEDCYTHVLHICNTRLVGSTGRPIQSLSFIAITSLLLALKTLYTCDQRSLQNYMRTASSLHSQGT